MTVVRSDGCHLCEDAIKALGELSAEYPLTVRVVELDSPEGKAISRTHRPPMSPAVLLDGALFSWGRLPRRKLRRYLERLAREVKAG